MMMEARKEAEKEKEERARMAENHERNLRSRGHTSHL
jgi:hypothetical protein